MASELQVTTIRGVPTGSNANQIVIPTGQVLTAPGHIVQVVHRQSSDVYSGNVSGSNIQASSNSWVSGGTESELTITPKFANSYILLQCVINTDNANTDSRAMYTIFKSVNAGAYTNLTPNNSNNYDSLARIHDLGERIIIGQEMQFYDAVSSTQTHRYRVYVKNQNSGQTARLRNDIIPLKFTAMEIAQ